MITDYSSEKLALCICTYQRPQLLRRLLDDIHRQTRLPNLLIIVDGDPRTGEILPICREHTGLSTIYIPSNHANLPYQRYLGWRAACASGEYDFLLYLDDDLRLTHPDTLLGLMKPLGNIDVVGVTAPCLAGGPEKFAGNQMLQDRAEPREDHPLTMALGASGQQQPGGLTPSGERLLPAVASTRTTLRGCTDELCFSVSPWSRMPVFRRIYSPLTISVVEWGKTPFCHTG